MLALVPMQDGDVSPFLQPLDGNRSDKASLLEAIIQRQLREAVGEASVYATDNGVYSQSNTKKSIIPPAETAECEL